MRMNTFLLKLQFSTLVELLRGDLQPQPEQRDLYFSNFDGKIAEPNLTYARL